MSVMDDESVLVFDLSGMFFLVLPAEAILHVEDPDCGIYLCSTGCSIASEIAPPTFAELPS